jgi:twinkle protein
LAKYVAVERDSDGKKRLTAQKNGLQVLFGMQHIKEDWCIITTGELDALSYAAQGLPAVSVTNGDKNVNWIENCWDFLDKLKTIYLSFDMDGSGDSMVATVAARLGVAKCKRVNTLPYNDANAAHINGISLHECIRTAKDITPTGFVRSSELADGVWDRLKNGPRHLRGIPFLGWDGIDESVNFRIRPQECTVYLGFEASGKSTILYQLCSYLAGVHGEKVGIASLEEDPEEILGIMLTQWMGEGCTPQDGLDETDFRLRYESTIAENIFIYNDRTADAPLKDILSFAEYCVKRYGVKHVVIDSITCTDIDIEDNKEANKFMKSVIKSMNETGAHYHIVAHAKKGNIDEFDRASIPKKRDIKGSVTIPALATNIVSIWRNGIKDSIIQNKKQTKFSPEEVAEWCDGVIAIRKQKVGGKIGEFDMWYNPNNFKFRRKQNWPDSTYFKIPQ